MTGRDPVGFECFEFWRRSYSCAAVAAKAAAKAVAAKAAAKAAANSKGRGGKGAKGRSIQLKGSGGISSAP